MSTIRAGKLFGAAEGHQRQRLERSVGGHLPSAEGGRRLRVCAAVRRDDPFGQGLVTVEPGTGVRTYRTARPPFRIRPSLPTMNSLGG